MNRGSTAPKLGMVKARRTGRDAIAISTTCVTTAATGALVRAETQIRQVVSAVPVFLCTCAACTLTSSTMSAMQAPASRRCNSLFAG